MLKQMSCDLCTKAFASRKSLSKHKKIHSGIKKYNCKHCNKSFGKSSELERHILIHTREKTHKCTKCDKSFSRDDTLKQHSLIHSGEKPRKCTQCDKSFVQRGDLKRHLLIHSGEKPHKCIWCNYSCNTAFSLKTHIKKHTGEKLHQCNQREYKTSRSSHLMRHKKMHTREIFTIAINAITKQQNQARWRDTRGRTLKKSHTDAQRASIRALQLVIWRFTWWQSTPEKSRSSVTSATMLALILVICSATWGRILGRDHSSATNAARLTKIREILQNISKFIVPKYGSVSRWLNQMQPMWWTSKGNRISPDNDLVLRLHFRTQSLFGQRVSRVAEVLFNMVLVIDFFSHSTEILEFIFLHILSGTWFGLDDKDDNDPLIRNRHGLDKTSTKYYHLYHDSYHDSYHYYQSMPITMIRMN